MSVRPFSSFPSEQLRAAREQVAADWKTLALEIRADLRRKGNTPTPAYEAHLQSMENAGPDIIAGRKDGNFTIWQRIYEQLTGECVPFLPPPTIPKP